MYVALGYKDDNPELNILIFFISIILLALFQIIMIKYGKIRAQLLVLTQDFRTTIQVNELF